MTRLTRGNAGDENLDAKPHHIAGAKGAVGAAKPSTVSGIVKQINANASTTAAERLADVGAKRKREALGEVTNSKGGKTLPGLKGSEDSKTSTRTIIKKTTRAVVVKAEETTEAGLQRLRDRPSLRSANSSGSTRTLSTTSVRTAKKTVAASVTNSRTASTITEREEDEDEDEIERAMKKQRTSDELGPDVLADVLEVAEDLVAADPLELKAPVELQPPAEADKTILAVKQEIVEDWDDLDKDDDDDPAMVSEYVVEIFHYLKELEVCHIAGYLHTLTLHNS